MTMVRPQAKIAQASCRRNPHCQPLLDRKHIALAVARWNSPRNLDGALSFKLLIVSNDGNTGEAEGLLKPRDGVAVWKNEEFDCELTFRWQGNAVKMDQQGMCGFGMGVDGSGVYVR